MLRVLANSLAFLSLHFDFIETSSFRERIRANRHVVHMLHKMASRQRGVCVKHLKRCKTSIACNFPLGDICPFLLNVFDNKGDFKQGVPRLHSSVRGTNEDYSDVIWRGSMQPDQLHVPASFFMSMFCNGKWLTRKPPCRLEDHDLVKDGTIASSKDVERILLRCFSRLVTYHFLSGLTEVFLHVRCIPHQNSQRCF